MQWIGSIPTHTQTDDAICVVSSELIDRGFDWDRMRLIGRKAEEENSLYSIRKQL